MKSLFVCTFAIIGWGFLGCRSDDHNNGEIPRNDPNDLGPTLLNTENIDASNKLLAFTHRLADKLISETRNRHVVFSPLSIAGALQLLQLGARSRTYNELTQLLGYQPFASTSESIHSEFERLTGVLLASNSNLNDPEVEHFVKVANALFVQEGVSLRQEYKNVLQSIYRADTFNVDFRSPAVVQLANKWVEESTHGKVKEILSKPLDEQTKVMIASSVYFNAKWKTTFFEDMTKPRPFWLEGRQNPSVQVEMMAFGGKLPFYDATEYDCRIIGLPYKNSTSTMFILLPNNSSSTALRNLHHRLSADAINQMIANMKMKTSIVFLPKMHLTNTIDVRRVLVSFGISNLFDPSSADLGLITDDDDQTTTNNGFIGGTLLHSVLNPIHNQFQPVGQHNLEDSLIFSRFNEESDKPADNDHKRPKRNTYKSGSLDGKNDDPLRMKDFVLRKRIMKENKLDKKLVRHRRQLLTFVNARENLRALDRLRNSNSKNPGLFANEIIHKVDLVVNEKGTEGGAATVVFLYKTGTNVVFKAEEPFLFYIRHEQSQLPIFYGAVFDPRSE